MSDFGSSNKNINIPKSSYYVNKECCERDCKIWMDENVIREYLLITNNNDASFVNLKMKKMRDNGLLYPNQEGSLVSGACFNQVLTPQPPPVEEDKVEGCFDDGTSHDEIPPLLSGTVSPKYDGYPASNYCLLNWMDANTHNVDLCVWPEGCADNTFPEPPLGNFDPIVLF